MEIPTRRGLPRAMVDDVFLAPVHINAGGTVYTTTLDTLTKYPESKLAKLFDGTMPISIDPISRQYFLDINGSVFAHVLDFLRYGELLLPDNFKQFPLLTKLAEYFGIQEMLASLGVQRDNTSQNESEEDNRVESRRQRRRKWKKSNTNEGNNNGDSSADKDIGAKKISSESAQLRTIKGSVEAERMKAESLNIKAIKSETTDVGKVEAKTVEADSMKTKTLEVGALKSEVAEMVSIGAVNVEMTSVDAGAVRTQSLEVGSLMAMTLEIGTLRAGVMETDTPSGPVKIVLVRYDEYYKIIDVYSPDALTLMDPLYPRQSVRSEHIGNSNRIFYKFDNLPCVNPQTTYKFGVPYLLNFFEQLLNKGYRFSSVITAGEMNYTRDYVLIRFPSPDTRP